MNPIPDHLAWGWMCCSSASIKPALGETGHHYANPRNRFWTILHRAGLTPRLYRAEEDGELLNLGYGFTNIVARPTPTAADITAAEYAEGATCCAAKSRHAVRRPYASSARASMKLTADGEAWNGDSRTSRS